MEVSIRFSLLPNSKRSAPNALRVTLCVSPIINKISLSVIDYFFIILFFNLSSKNLLIPPSNLPSEHFIHARPFA